MREGGKGAKAAHGPADVEIPAPVMGKRGDERERRKIKEGGKSGMHNAHRPAEVDIPAPVMRQMFLISPDLIFSAVASIETFPLKATSAPSLRKMLPIAATTALVLLDQFLSLLTAGFTLWFSMLNFTLLP